MTLTIYYLYLFFLSLTGWFLSFYFLGVVSNKIKSNSWWIPSFCRMNENSCSSLVLTKYGNIFGHPNAFWGMIYYSIIILFIFLAILSIKISYIFFIFSLLAFLLSIYLIFGLFKLKVNCPICITNHIIIFLMIFLTSHFNFIK